MSDNTENPGGWQVYAVRLWTLLATCLCAVSIVDHMRIGLNNDNLDLLDQVQRWLAGGVPYVAFADINPPLIHILYVIPVMLSRWTALSLASSLYLFTFALTALALIVTAAILRTSRATFWMALSTLALALISLPFIHQAFADRDHLTMVLASPWLVLYSPLARRESVPPAWRFAASLMGAVGFSIKPYAFVFYIAAMAFALCCGRILRELLRQWEHYVIGAFVLLYLAIIFLFFHDYLTGILPLAAQTYAVLSWDWSSKMGVMEYDLLGKFAVLPLAETALLLIINPALYGRTCTYLLLLLLAGLASYAVNGGWYYTQYPFIAVALLLGVAAGIRLLCAAGRIKTGSLRRLALALLGVAIAAGLYYDFARPTLFRAAMDMNIQRERGHPWENIEIVPGAREKIDRHLATHPRFMFFTTFERSVNLLQEGTPRRNVSRYDYLWPLPGLVRMQSQPYRQKEFQALSASFMQGMDDDMERQKPDVVISDASPYELALPAPFSFVDWLKKDPRFAKIWNNYALVDKVDACTPQIHGLCAFDIYYRK